MPSDDFAFVDDIPDGPSIQIPRGKVKYHHKTLVSTPNGREFDMVAIECNLDDCEFVTTYSFNTVPGRFSANRELTRHIIKEHVDEETRLRLEKRERARKKQKG